MDVEQWGALVAEAVAEDEARDEAIRNNATVLLATQKQLLETVKLCRNLVERVNALEDQWNDA